jgi:DNA-binding NarL/FixJ family response regulator
MTIRVVLGEDNVLVREGVRALLDSYDDVEVVGVASDAPTLMAAAHEHVPDVVVTDIKMPPSFQLEGIDCAHAIREQHPDTGVVVLSAHDDAEYAVALLGEGHSGLAYLLKDRIAQGDELVRAIHEVHEGGERRRSDDRRAAHREPARRRPGPQGARHDGARPWVPGDGRCARHDAGSGRPPGHRPVPPDGRWRRDRQRR